MRRRLLLIASVVSAALLTGACTSAGPATDSTDVAFKGCDQVACEGTLAGARFQILLPTTWNGTLLIYSHGYRAAQPVPPDFAPVSTEAEPAPGWSDDRKEVGRALLDQGYALAGSSWSANGWAVQEGVEAAEQLYRYFADNVGAPARVYAWGDSLGGLVTTVLAEKKPEWLSGAAPLCAPLAGLVPNMDLALDVSYAVRELIWPSFRITGWSSYEEAVKQLQTAGQKVVDAASDVKGGGTAKILFIAALVDAPLQTQKYDGRTTQSQVKAAVEGILTALAYSTAARYDIEKRVGGNPSDNTATRYSQRFTVGDQKRIDALTPGATARFAMVLAEGRRVAADPAARGKARTLGDPTGDAAVPLVTLHTAADPLVLVQNEGWYLERARARGGDPSQRLLQLITVAPTAYAESTGAPYGAGHCNFTPSSRTGVVTVLDDWVRLGKFPGSVSVTEALGEGSGVRPGAPVPPWPLGGVQPLDR